MSQILQNNFLNRRHVNTGNATVKKEKINKFDLSEI